MGDWKDPEEIWLQPWCEACDSYSRRGIGEGRMWCQDNAFDECEADNCQRKAVRYIRADLVARRKKETADAK